jgi:hypothetical protein
MSKAAANLRDKKEVEKLDYAVNLIELVSAKEKSPMRIIETALAVLDFGQITPKQFMEYLEATGR